MEEFRTGFPAIDAALGGLITGDNVAWLCDDADLYWQLATGFATTASEAGRGGLVVVFGQSRLDGLPSATTLDASARSKFARSAVLVDELERRLKNDPPSWLVVGDLGPAARRWGTDTLFGFFERVCPAMLEAGVTAYWHIDPSHGAGFVEHVRQITQCLLDVRTGRLRVMKAEGRPDGLQGVSYRLRMDGRGLDVVPLPAGGRLARGLLAVRKQFGLSQQELAEAAGVTASAVSQAESGVRGLSLDTVVGLADRLGISVDRLLSTGSPRSYRLARHDRSRRTHDGLVTALASDAAAGMRVYLLDIPGGSRVQPPLLHRGVSVIAPVRGLVQIELEDDRPVLRAGDVLVVETGPVHAWRNLRANAASCYWILRD